MYINADISEFQSSKHDKMYTLSILISLIPISNSLSMWVPRFFSSFFAINFDRKNVRSYYIRYDNKFHIVFVGKKKFLLCFSYNFHYVREQIGMIEIYIFVELKSFVTLYTLYNALCTV